MNEHIVESVEMGELESEDDILAAYLREWRADNGLTVEKAEDILGIPARTLEGIEQGRGFRYPKLLMEMIGLSDDLAMASDELDMLRQYVKEQGGDQLLIDLRKRWADGGSGD